MSYTLPGCGNAKDWADCVEGTNPKTGQPYSNTCVKCDKLSDYCASFAGAGFGNVVPKSCASTCCESAEPVKKLLVGDDSVAINKPNKSKSGKNKLLIAVVILLILVLAYLLYRNQ